jgi:hypothetical protein
MPKIRTPWEAAKARAAEMQKMEEELRRLRTWREQRNARLAQEAEELAAQKRVEADDLLRACGYQHTRLQNAELKKLLESRGAEKGSGSLNKAALERGSRRFSQEKE